MVTLDLLAPPLVEILGQRPLEHVVVTSLAERMPAWRGWLYRVERLRRHGPFACAKTPTSTGSIKCSADAAPPGAAHRVPEEDVALLAPTGGTTASPKAVMLTHRNLVANAIQLRAWGRGEDGCDNVLACCRSSMPTDCRSRVLASMVAGSTIHLYPRFEAEAVLDLLERERISLVPAVPAMLAALNRELHKKPRDLSLRPRRDLGASALDQTVRQSLRSSARAIWSRATACRRRARSRTSTRSTTATAPARVGLPLPDTEARIMDQATGRKSCRSARSASWSCAGRR